METDGPQSSVSARSQTAFQLAASDVLAQRLEAIALEIRAAGTQKAGMFTGVETLGLFAAVLQGTLRKIDEIFEYDGFVFTPGCTLLLELFQARTRGVVLTHKSLCQSVNCSTSVSGRWINALVSMHLLESFGEESEDEKRVCLTERGYIKVMAALRLLI